MPEFQRQKHKSLTNEQLYEEYNRIDEPKSKPKSGSTAKKKKKPVAKEASPVNHEHRERQQEPQKEHRKEQQKEQQNKQQKEAQRRPVKKRKPASAKANTSAKKKRSSKPNTRKRGGKMTLYYVLAAVVAIAAVSIMSVTVLFNISSFAVEGNTVYSEEQIIAASGIDKGNNLLRINIGSAEERIVSSLVYIDAARISRSFPNRLVINVEPAQPALSFAVGSSFYIISERGRLLEIGQISADCPVVKGFVSVAGIQIGEQLEDDEEGRIGIALRMIKYMREYGLNRYCEIDLSDTLNIILTYDGRVVMELGASTQLEDKFYHASLLVKDEIAANERCSLILSNPDRVVKRPIYGNDGEDEGYIVEDGEDENDNDEDNDEDNGLEEPGE